MLTRRAYAKINLGLRVLRRREDSYHDIETVFHQINLYDTLEGRVAADLRLECDDPTIPTDSRNLVLRAALLLREECGPRRGAHLRLAKRIPAGSGLGGGSSDAAAALLCLAELWDISLTPERLGAIALELGSDVPYFLQSGTAHALGRGEMLEYFPLALPFWILVAVPPVQVSTAWAYGLISPRQRLGEPSLREILSTASRDPERLARLLTNDFEEPIAAAVPPIGEALRMLRASEALLASMSGSGSGVFAFFNLEEDARRAAAVLTRTGASVSLTEPLFRPVGDPFDSLD